MNIRRYAFAVLVLGALSPVSTRAFAQSTTSRLALVIGEAQYRDGPLATAANDGGLMADLLRQAGYDVTGAANLSQDQIRAAFREFLEKAAAVGPQAEIFVYLSGKGLQFAGDNYLAPIEATIADSASVPAEAVRLSDFIGPLGGLPARARVIVLDLSRPNNFGRAGQPLASGLAIVDAPDNSLVAFNDSPGTIAPDDKGPYGAYAQSLVEMLRQPGLPIDDAFAQVRLRVNEATRGGQTPWNVTKLSTSIALFAPAPGAPPPRPLASRPQRPMRDVSPQEAYGYAVQADTYDSYNQFLVAYPGDPLARRVRAMIAARREAITWRRTFVANSPEAYWTYLQRYPRGPHSGDAGRRLAFLSAPLAPPPRFREYDAYDIPPPPPEEIIIVDRPRYFINEIVDVPPPRYSDEFLPPIGREYRDLPPPPPPPRAGFLPIPIPIPIPFSRPIAQPGFVTAPRFVQQPGPAQPGGGAPAPAVVPQGYSPAPPAGPRGPAGASVPQTQPVPPAAPGAASPVGRPPGSPPAPGGAPAQPSAVPGAPPPSPAPSQLLPPPGRPSGAPAGTPSGTPVAPQGAPANRPAVTPSPATPSQTLPTPGGTGPAPAGRPPAGVRPTTPTSPGTAVPRETPATTPAGRPAPDAVRPTPSPTPGASRPTPAEPVKPATPTGTPPRATPEPVKPLLPREAPAAPRSAPAEPKVAPPTPRAEPVRPAPVAPPPMRAEPPRAAPPPVRAEPPPVRVEPPRAAPPPVRVEPPRPVAPPPAAAPRAPAPQAAPPAGAPKPPGGPRPPGLPGAPGER